jgi:hypothetical protein
MFFLFLKVNRKLVCLLACLNVVSSILIWEASGFEAALGHQRRSALKFHDVFT